MGLVHYTLSLLYCSLEQTFRADLLLKAFEKQLNLVFLQGVSQPFLPIFTSKSPCFASSIVTKIV